MRRLNPKRANPEPRWRQQSMREVPDNRCPCGKLYYACHEDAAAKAAELTTIYSQPHYVYEHHGKVHLTTQPQG